MENGKSNYREFATISHPLPKFVTNKVEFTPPALSQNSANQEFNLQWLLPGSAPSGLAEAKNKKYSLEELSANPGLTNFHK